MNCDICGRNIAGQPFRVKVEGAKLLVCNRCQRLGTPYAEPVAPRPLAVHRSASTRPFHKSTQALPRHVDELDIAEDCAERVRKQRMKLGLSQDDLAKRVKEKLSVIQKIETGKMAPDTKLCRLLEHELRIKILVPRKEVLEVPAVTPVGVTLGDIMKIRNKSKSD